MKNKEIKAMALQQFKEDRWPDVGENFVYEAINTALTGFGGIPVLLLGGQFEAGYAKYLLKKVRKEEDKKFTNLFEGFKNFGVNLGAYCIRFIYIFLWSCLFLIPGIIKSYAYSMQFFIMQDCPEIDGGQALVRSSVLMQGHKWQLFCLELRFIGWIILSCFTFGILYFLYVGPWMQIAKANFYNELKAESADKIAEFKAQVAEAREGFREELKAEIKEEIKAEEAAAEENKVEEAASEENKAE